MAARRCSNCGINWPGNEPDYNVCASCNGATEWIGNDKPDFEGDEARAVQTRYKFDAYCEVRGEREYVPETEQRAKEWRLMREYYDALGHRDKTLIALRDAPTYDGPR